jgi:hypothetical protein
VDGCNGTWYYHEAEAVFRCDTCDWELTYEEAKGCDLFARHLIEHYFLTEEDSNSE